MTRRSSCLSFLLTCRPRSPRPDFAFSFCYQPSRRSYCNGRFIYFAPAYSPACHRPPFSSHCCPFFWSAFSSCSLYFSLFLSRFFSWLSILVSFDPSPLNEGTWYVLEAEVAAMNVFAPSYRPSGAIRTCLFRTGLDTVWTAAVSYPFSLMLGCELPIKAQIPRFLRDVKCMFPSKSRRAWVSYCLRVRDRARLCLFAVLCAATRVLVMHLG